MPVTGSIAPRSHPEVEDGDAHVLRLCLDLQLDAMLLTLGAAATYARPATRAPATDTDGGPPDAALPADDPGRGEPADGQDPPWRRWLSEDVDLAVTLAADAQAGRAMLPSTLGSELQHSVPATVVDNLDARYSSMRSLLADLLAARPAPDSAWRPRLQDALERCEQRLAELREHRLEVTPPRGIATAAGPHHYLPGELLG